MFDKRLIAKHPNSIQIQTLYVRLQKKKQNNNTTMSMSQRKYAKTEYINLNSKHKRTWRFPTNIKQIYK